MKIYNSKQNSLVADDVKVAQTFCSRSVGLLSRKSLGDDEALIIKPCCSIHTFFMKFEIDALFINKKNEIIALYQNVKPWRVLPLHLNSTFVIELPSGKISSQNLQKGDIIQINE